MKKVLIGLFSLIIVSLFALAFFTYLTHGFTSWKWKTVPTVWRTELGIEIIENELLLSKGKKEVIELLGNDIQHDLSNDKLLVYYIGGDYFLAIHFDDEDKVIKCTKENT